MKQISSIVIGLGFGDEGKGITTDYLCSQTKNALVIRFSGGHQAGHTVVNEAGVRHVFSSFGAGTLQGIPSYWSRFCTLSPIAFYNELQALLKAGFTPKIYVDALTMITTPFDILYNRNTEKTNQHGSCGLGFGATVQRNESPYKLYALDLLQPTIWQQKLDTIRQYYEQKANITTWNDVVKKEIELFEMVIESILPYIEIVHEIAFFDTIQKEKTIEHFVFEGSQGILLDMDHGCFFPNVTRANTVSKNAMQLIKDNQLPVPEIYYITRAYQTRHGNGFLSNEGLPLNVVDNPLETNQYNPWQGHQRKSLLDIDMLNYALQSDHNYSGNVPKNLVVTCLDQVEGSIRATLNGEILKFESTQAILPHLNIEPKQVFESYSDCSVGFKVII